MKGAFVGWWLGLMAALGCSNPVPPPAPPLPSILVLTLDTTRADAITPEVAPHLSALAARGVSFAHAYATAPMTLPSHASMWTGLYPAGHGVHENSRTLPAGVATAAEALRAAGYGTAAFVSGFPLDRQFGLARGFERYDDELGGPGLERRATATVDLALAELAARGEGPFFLWVHTYDPHEPYTPPEPFASRFAARPYLGEVAFMDRELGRLVAAFESKYKARGARVLVVGDHGEGLGEHGEKLHGNLLYQATMRVPLMIAGDGIAPGVETRSVSARHVFDTVLGWARGEATPGLLAPGEEIVLGEAMAPFLDYGWQPQVMGVAGTKKVIWSGALEAYDLAADPREERDLAGTAEVEALLLRTLREYPLPGKGSPAAPADPEAQRRLASLGYIASESPPRLKANAPRAKDMTHLFAALEESSELFASGRYREAAGVFENILAQDPGNLMVALRLAAGASALGEDRSALGSFERASRIDPESLDLKHYLGLHHLSFGRPQEAEELLAAVVEHMPDRLPAWSGLAEARMMQRKTEGAIEAFERARTLAGQRFEQQLELGVCYLATRRFVEAASSLDQVAADHPAKAMALFKRAQVAVLLGEPDAAQRVRAAREGATPETRGLIANERLFRNLSRDMSSE